MKRNERLAGLRSIWRSSELTSRREEEIVINHCTIRLFTVNVNKFWNKYWKTKFTWLRIQTRRKQVDRLATVTTLSPENQSTSLKCDTLYVYLYQHDPWITWVKRRDFVLFIYFIYFLSGMYGKGMDVGKPVKIKITCSRNRPLHQFLRFRTPGFKYYHQTFAWGEIKL